MNQHYLRARNNRSYIPFDLEINSWEDIEKYFNDLLTRNIHKTEDLEKWLINRSELEAVLEEDMAWRYISMSCDTANRSLSERFNDFALNIEPKAHKAFHELDIKVYNDSYFKELDTAKYFVFTRALKKRMEIYREENLKLFSELQVEEQQYGSISGEMTIMHDGKELTLPQAQNLLKKTDRSLRKKIFFEITARRSRDYQKLNQLLDGLIGKRHQVAQNAGFKNYRDYKFTELGRFDYHVQDVLNFHTAIEDAVCPVVDSINLERKEKLKVDNLKPWDLDVDTASKEPLKPFETARELIDKTIQCLNDVDPMFGEFISVMDKNGYLDLESRKGKAPGGFNYPLYESNIPFIFMNATQNLRDLETMVHEGGHAIHSFLSKNLELVSFKNLPSEVAELASMSMELISMEYWHHFFSTEEELKRAKISQLEGVLKVLPWVATIDTFQHWLYENPKHNHEERNQAWIATANRFGSDVVDWSGIERDYGFLWQKQLHIYQVPFYYIEYGIAQLGAIALWRNFKSNPSKTIAQYKNALSLGYSVPIPDIYREAGIKFDLSSQYVADNIRFIQSELNELKSN
jgi:oligoendopeptidase F